MIRALAIWVAIVCPFATLADGEKIVLGLSHDEVAITATFTGSEILIFGAVKRDAPLPDGGPLEVVITVSGPLTPVTVRHKERRYGIWVNTDAVLVDAAPSFYAVATTGPLRDVLSETEDLRNSISIPRAIRSVGALVENSADYTDALIRIRAGEGQYQVLEGAVDLEQQTLFRAQVALPANLIEGDYATRIFLTRGGRIVDSYTTEIAVQKVGLERWLFNLSNDAPLLYGLLSLAIAIIAGWSASAAFQGLRR
jgi:uncharacterized protein (TIGR02186 family)